MPRLHYVDHDFGPKALEVIRQANAIIAEYAAQGYDLTLRQLYYQFVSRDLIPNRQSEYTAASFAVEKWADQPQRVEVWIEKDALVGVFEPVCQELDVPLFSCRGYTSQSEVWGAAQRLEAYLQAGQEVLILHFGDHDPSGLDMTRDIEERLRLFLLHDWIRFEVDNHAHLPLEERKAWLIREHPSSGWDTRLDVRRLALTWSQIQRYSPPPNPAKSTDARYRKYAEEHGHESWELDALEPTVLGQLVRDAIDAILDHHRWDAAVERENAGAARLEAVSKRWTEIEDLVG